MDTMDGFGPAPSSGSAGPWTAAASRLWLTSVIHQDSAPYVITAAYRLRGPVDQDRLAAAVRALPALHPALAIRYELADGELSSTPAPEAQAFLQVNQDEPDTDLDALVGYSIADWFWDLAEPPHLRATLWEFGPEDSLLVVGVHHIAADATGFDRLMRDLLGLYDGSIAEGPAGGVVAERPVGESAIAESPVAESAASQSVSAPAAPVPARVLERSAEYWAREFAEPVEQLELPLARSGAVPPQQGLLLHDEVEFDLDLAVAAVGGAQATGGSTVTALFGAYLALLAGQEEICIAYPLPPQAVADSGATTLGIVRLPVVPEAGAVELARLCQRKVLFGMRNPYGALAGWTAARASGTDTLPTVIVQWLPGAGDFVAPPMAGIEAVKVRTPLWTSEFDLDLWITGRPGSLGCRLGFRPDRIPPEAVAALVDGFVAFCAAAAEEPSRPVRELPMAGGESAAPQPWSAPADAPDVFTAIRRMDPARPAIRTPAGTTSYGDLLSLSGRWAQAFAGRGIGAGVAVAVDLQPGTAPEIPYGIWAAGAVYVPFTADLPAERVRYLLDACQAEAVVTDRAPWYREHFPELALFTAEAPAQDQEQDPDFAPPEPDQSAYVVFTSGSTGSPKAVKATHANLWFAVCAFQDAVGVAAGARIAQVSAPTFDPALLEMLLAVRVGGCQSVAPAPVRRDPRELARWLDAEQVGFFEATPTVWEALLPHLAPLTSPPAVCASGGEVLSDGLAERIAELGGPVWNLYGPSETTVWATAHRWPGSGRPAIGQPLPGVGIRVADRHLRTLPDGFVGELVISGPGVTRGYPGAPELTADRFVPGPDGLCYRSGDLGRREANADSDGNGDGTGAGDLYFVGRVDRQVKLNGRRIDPGEAEAVLSAHPAIRQAVVVVRPVPGRDGDALCAYAVAADPQVPLDRDEVLLHLRERLPRHAVPAVLVELAELPRTATGKIDPAALPEPAAADLLQLIARYVPPSTPTETAVATAFEQILGTSPVGLHDDFFDLGGTSITGLRLSRLLEGLLGTELPVSVIYEGVTVHAIAAQLDDLKPGSDSWPPEPQELGT
jgi:amino acid adenylation domain-containing protein